MNFYHYISLKTSVTFSLNKAEGRFVSGLGEISFLDSTGKLNDNDNIWQRRWQQTSDQKRLLDEADHWELTVIRTPSHPHPHAIYHYNSTTIPPTLFETIIVIVCGVDLFHLI